MLVMIPFRVAYEIPSCQLRPPLDIFYKHILEWILPSSVRTFLVISSFVVVASDEFMVSVV